MSSNEKFKSAYQKKKEEVIRLTRVELEDPFKDVETYHISAAELNKNSSDFHAKIIRNENEKIMTKVLSKELYTK